MLLCKMISLCLSYRFQIIVGKNVVEVSGQYSLEAPNICRQSAPSSQRYYIVLAYLAELILKHAISPACECGIIVFIS